MRNLVRAGLTSLALATVALPGCGSDGSPATLRSTQYGLIDGVDKGATSGTLAWLGVPFAKPPVGSLRWSAPVDPDPWTDVRPAKSFGPACVQYGRIYGPGSNNTYDTTIATTLNQAVGSEDCLYLNVWRPASGERNLPVIVFIHGGSNVSGYTADPMYDGATLAKSQNAVVVTVNYRVGVFGWFSLAQLRTGDPDGDSGNFGTLDNIKALRWVKRNIANFGGDPGNVTLMGQSAGAINAWVLMTAPQVQGAGLFHRLVALSGGMSLASNLPTGMLPTLNPASYYATQGTTMLANLLVGDGKATDAASAADYAATQTSQQIADYMRSKSPSTILATLLTKMASIAGSGPIPDGTVLPEDPIAAVAAGRYTKIPVLAGNTGEEGKLFASFLALSPALGGVPGLIVGDAERFMMMYDFDPDGTTTLTDASLINAQYLPVDTPVSGYNAKTTLLANIFMIPSLDNVLNTLKTQQSNVWYYEFDWAQEPAPWNHVYGAAHAFDLPFVFGNFGPSLFSNATGGNANKGGRLALSAAMMASLGAFARTGDPNAAALGVNWPAWPSTLVFDATLADKKISVK